MIERFIDYMQFSCLINETTCIEQKFDTVYPVRFYSRGYRHPFGYRIYYGNPKSALALVVAAGEAMQNMRDNDMLDAEILQHALSIGAKFSRIDLAVTQWNTFDGFITIGDIEKWYSEGLIISNLVVGGSKKIVTIAGNGVNIPETLYIGDMLKRGKKGIFRAYDKGIELDLGQYMATRLELEQKGDNAHNSALRIADTNDIAGNFRSRFNVRHKDFDKLMDADVVKIQRGAGKIKGQEHEEEQDRRWAWLMSQVAPSLKRAIEDDIESGKGYDRLGLFLAKAGIKRKALSWNS